MMRDQKLWIGTSWKMHKTLIEAEAFVQGLVDHEVRHDPRIQRFVIPPFTVVRDVAAGLSGTTVKVGAQNMHWQDQGAWTGEISPPMIKDCGVALVELGHSERRRHFGETDKTVALKTEAAIRHGLIPLICIGETLAERDAGQASEVLANQVTSALGLLSEKQKTAPLLLAYEPVWAIGEAGIPATADYANARHGEIISVAERLVGRQVPCLYGGSVNPDNCQELITCPHIDGLFIGRSAWDVTGYLDILARASQALQPDKETSL